MSAAASAIRQTVPIDQRRRSRALQARPRGRGACSTQTGPLPTRRGKPRRPPMGVKALVCAVGGSPGGEGMVIGEN